MIDVVLTRDSLRDADVAVVIDVLRATSTAAQALAAGYGRVLFADSIERAERLRGPGRVLAGERQCVTPPGFDQGNSPLEARERRGDELVLATTNGAPTVVAAAARAPMVLLACLLNLDAVIQALRTEVDSTQRDVRIVCSGTGGAVALEDVYVAGRLSVALDGPRTDATRMAEAVARAYPTPLEALAASEDAEVLRANGLEDDISYCSRESELPVVPSVLEASDGVAAVGTGERIEQRSPRPAVVDRGDTVSV